MARLGVIFQSVSLVVVFLAALACASGTKDTEGTGGTYAGTGGTGGTGASGQPGTAPGLTGGGMEPPGGVTGGTSAATGGTGQTAGTGGTSAATGGTGQTAGTGGQSVCGDNVKDADEICDGTDLGTATCEEFVPGSSGTLQCAADCLNFNTDMCFQADAGGDASYGNP